MLTRPDRPKTRKIAGLKPVTESRIERNGLKSGTVAPEFVLPDIYGRSISLQQYRGRRVLLVFSDPHCGPCNQLAPYLERTYRRRRTILTEIVMVSRGDVEQNRQKAEAYGFEFPVVLQDRWKLSKKYGIFATPVAFLISEDGRIEGDVAVGFEQIRNLLREEFASGRIERFMENMKDASAVLSGSLPRRHAFRMAVFMIASAVLSTAGIPETVLAQCSGIVCGTACCNSSTQACCNASTSTCCNMSLVCCFGVCCAPGQVCISGRCRTQVLP